MFVINEDRSIHVTRGDIVFFDVSATYNGAPYTFVVGDVLRMRVFEKKACNCVVLVKDFPVTEETQTVTIHLTANETKLGGVLSKPVDYWYEIELNPDTNPQTIIGYNDDGAAIFKLFPEGKEITEGEIENEKVKGDVDKIIEKYVENHFIETPIQEIVYTYLDEHPVSDGETPYIGANGNWWIGITDTGVKAGGNDGEDGKDGKDGVVPLMRINQSTTVWEVSYDDGGTWASLGVSAKGMDGKDGANGRDGETGASGKDGYTPVKGVDYFTDADIEEMVAAVITALTDGDEVSY